MSRPKSKQLPKTAKPDKQLSVQKREQLKNIIISKFKTKYGNHPSIATHVTNFLTSQKLTEENLKKLDKIIQQETKPRPPSQKSAKEQKNTEPKKEEAHKEEDAASMKSYKSSRVEDSP